MEGGGKATIHWRRHTIEQEVICNSLPEDTKRTLIRYEYLVGPLCCCFKVSTKRQENNGFSTTFVMVVEYHNQFDAPEENDLQ